MDLVQTITEATQEIFSSMVMLDTSPGVPFQRQGEPLIDSVSGVITFEGKFNGLVAIHLPNLVAIEVASSFIDSRLYEIDENVYDSIGELTNIIAGSIKIDLDPGGGEIQLSMPSCVSGDEYSINDLTGSTNVSIPFYLDDGEFIVELQLDIES